VPWRCCTLLVWFEDHLVCFLISAVFYRIYELSFAISVVLHNLKQFFIYQLDSFFVLVWVSGLFWGGREQLWNMYSDHPLSATVKCNMDFANLCFVPTSLFAFSLPEVLTTSVSAQVWRKFLVFSHVMLYDWVYSSWHFKQFFIMAKQPKKSVLYSYP